MFRAGQLHTVSVDIRCLFIIPLLNDDPYWREQAERRLEELRNQ
jgi:hypothetical protein